MNAFIGPIIKFFAFLIRLFHIPFLVLFSLWLLQILYFPHLSYRGFSVKPTVDIPEYEKDKQMLISILKHREPVSRGHFHIADEYITRMINKLDSDPPFCMRCHGTYPHSKEKKTRALTNLHTSIMACEVCHIRRDPGDENHYFTWVDLKTGVASSKVDGGYGKYEAVIVPVKVIDGDDKRLDKILGEKFPEYEKFTPDLDEEMKKKIHDHLSKKPVPCLDCHKKKGYMDFKKLGFPESRTNQLVSSEVSRMVKHYDTFHMPKMLRFK
jgi:hypothetical protein